MNTTAYTKRRAEFNDLLYQNIIRPGATSSAAQTVVPSGIQLGLGVRTAAIYRITGGTGLTNTNNSLDLAIQGRGYFQIELPEGKGIAYTRDGAFQKNGDGVIVTHDGYIVQPEVTIPDEQRKFISTTPAKFGLNRTARPMRSTSGSWNWRLL